MSRADSAENEDWTWATCASRSRRHDMERLENTDLLKTHGCESICSPQERVTKGCCDAHAVNTMVLNATTAEELLAGHASRSGPGITLLKESKSGLPLYNGGGVVFPSPTAEESYCEVPAQTQRGCLHLNGLAETPNGGLTANGDRTLKKPVEMCDSDNSSTRGEKMRKTETLGPMVVVLHRGLDLAVLWKRPTDWTFLILRLNAKGEGLKWTTKQTLVKAHGLLRPSQPITNTKTLCRRPVGSITMDTKLQWTRPRCALLRLRWPPVQVGLQSTWLSST